MAEFSGPVNLRLNSVQHNKIQNLMGEPQTTSVFFLIWQPDFQISDDKTEMNSSNLISHF